jgi:hypothetical protein
VEKTSKFWARKASAADTELADEWSISAEIMVMFQGRIEGISENTGISSVTTS